MTSSDAECRQKPAVTADAPRIRIPMEDETSGTVAVVRAVAEAEGESPGDLPLLSDVIDPEAFDSLFDDDRPGRSGVSLSFNYCGYVVTITDDGVALDAR